MSEADKIYQEEIGEAREKAKKELSFWNKIKLKFDEELQEKVEERADEIAKKKTRSRIAHMSLSHIANQAARQSRVDQACGLRRF